ncbi:DnaJ domain-containing protein [Malonomonas rubra DSM 5091]|uniref:DnaJ domain-containing protein n=1 Tax=Malonomonas rubra DSM 5091 TaxID=1122189 RepID=A0A1M6GFB2_MALRU|nr:J domain-containing protein [Malonomonas rubra]SHJ08533.1 DnaJ domain-containing protein [Malonomonas rubra DSM 5091]
MTFDDLQAALDEFDLSSQTSWKKIKARHRELVRRYHPDKGEQADPDRIRRINAAYKILSTYVGDYRFDFSREQFLDQYPEERLREQFWSEKLWGDDI